MLKSKNKLFNSPLILTDKKNKIIDYNIQAKDNFPGVISAGRVDISSFDKFDLLCANLNETRVYTKSDYFSIDNIFLYAIDNFCEEIIIIDSAGIVIYCNPQFETNHGIKPSDIIGKDIHYITDKNIVDHLMFDKVISQKKTISFKQKTKNGRIFLNTSSPIFDDKRNIIYVIENCKDITETEILNNTLNHAQHQLKKTNDTKDEDNVVKNTFQYFKSPTVRDLLIKTLRFSEKDVNVLITGASGTGKTSLARFIHENSPRKNMTFVSINCTTLPENLIESELFGYKKGSFTGALHSGKKGLVEQAQGGTLFLDEIGELPMNVQAKLLELVQEKKYLPIGARDKKDADIRIITATNRKLQDLVEKGEFREDLYYRLNVVQLHMPPLNERKEDLEVFINHFVNFFNNKYGTNIKFSPKVYTAFSKYSWPGNIRELEYLIEYLIINAQKNIVNTEDLPTNITNVENKTEEVSSFYFDTDEKNDLKLLLEEAESGIIKSFYTKYPSSYKLAEVLSISQSKAHRLINKYCK